MGVSQSRCKKIADETRPAYFAARNDGLVVLDTIPNTIGAELKLLRRNYYESKWSHSKSAEEFYDALQTKTTGAFCKLEVLDTKGELRLAQTALYAGGHHELGIVFVEQEHEWDSEAM